MSAQASHYPTMAVCASNNVRDIILSQLETKTDYQSCYMFFFHKHVSTWSNLWWLHFLLWTSVYVVQILHELRWQPSCVVRQVEHIEE